MANIVFDDHLTIPTSKHKKKHRKHEDKVQGTTKDTSNFNTTEVYSHDLNTGNHVHINNEELNVIQKHKRIDFSAVQTCTVFDKTEAAPNKPKKKRKKDESHLYTTYSCTLLDNHDTVSDATCRKKGKENNLTTNNAAIFNELKTDSNIRHKGKNKKRKSSDINCDDVYTHPDNPELNHAAIKRKKHKKYNDNCCESNTENCTNSNELQITSHNLKSANKDCDSNKIESFSQHNNSGSNSATNNKNYNKNLDLINTASAVLDDNELIPTNKHKKKHKKNNYLSSSTDTFSTGNNFDINNIELSDFEKHKKKSKKDRSHSATIDSCSTFDDQETISDIASKKKSKESGFIADNDAVLGELEIDSTVRHKKKHKKIKNSDLNCNEVYTYPINSKLNHRAKKCKKHKKYKDNCGENNTENCTNSKELQLTSYIPKSTYRDGDLNKIESYCHHNNSELNSTTNNKSNKENPDLIPVANTVLEDNELIPTNKHKKKHKKNTYLISSADALSTGNHLDVNNIELRNSEKHNKSHFNSVQTCTAFCDNTVLDNDKLIPTNKCKKKHKGNKEKNYSSTKHALSTGNHININNIKLNDNKKHKKRDFSIAQTCIVFDKNEKTSNKQKKDKNHLAVIGSSSLFNDHKTTSSITGRRKSKKSVLTTDNAAVFDELKTDSNIRYKKKHKKAKNSEINCDEVYADPVYTELYHVAKKKKKKHKKYKDNCSKSNIKNCITSSKDLQTTSHNHKSATILDDNKLIPIKKHKKKCKENNYLNTTDALSTKNHRGDNNIELSESQKQKKSDFNSVQTCNVFDKNKTTSNKQKKKQEKDIVNHSTTIDSCSVFDDHEAISDVAYRKKSKENSLTTDDVAVFNEHKIDSNVGHKKKHKKRKYSDINCVEVDTHPDISELNYIVKKRKKHKKYDNNCGESNSGTCTFSKETQITCHIQENKNTDCDSNDIEVYSHRNTLELSSSEKCINDEEYPDLSAGVNTIFDDNEKIPIVKSKMKHKKDEERNCLNATDAIIPNILVLNYTDNNENNRENSDLNIVFKDREIIPSKKHKNKQKQSNENNHLNTTNALSAVNQLDIANMESNCTQRDECCDFNSVQTCTVVDENETTYKHKKYRLHLANTNCCTLDDFETTTDVTDRQSTETGFNITDSSVIDEIKINHDTHKKKHKKRNESDLNCDKIYTYADNSELNYSTAKKRKKHKKYQDGYDESNIEACNEESQTMSHNHKRKHENCSSNDIEAYSDLNTSELNSTTADKNDTECLDLNTLASTVLDDNKIIPTEKHKKKHKRNKENNYKTTTETFSGILSTRNHIDINNIQSNVLEKDISNSTCNTFNAENSTLAIIDEHNNPHLPLSNSLDNVEENTNEKTNSCSDHVVKTNNLALCLDCNDDPVDFEVPPLHKCETARNLREHQRKDFLSQGIKIKRGRFIANEDQIIKKNYENFVKKYSVPDSVELLGVGRYARDMEILKFIKAKHFYLRLAEGLNDRTLYSIYNRARLIILPLTKADNKLSEREVTHLVNAHRTISNKWQRIGDALGRTVESCQRTQGRQKKPISKETFTEEEKQQLIEAIRKVTDSWEKLNDMLQDYRIVNYMKKIPIAPQDKTAPVYRVEQLPGAQRCKLYDSVFHKPSTKEAKNVIENKSGCTQSGTFSKRPKYDIFNILASEHHLGKVFVPPEEDDGTQKTTRRSTNLALSFRNMKTIAPETVGVYRSSIHGRGLFCKRNVNAGELIIEYIGEVIRSILVDKREKIYQSKGIRGCYMFRIDDDEVVDATMYGNAARFINHSCEPNCFSKVFTIDGRKHILIFALRRTRKGEELTFDYKFAFEEEKIPCYCNSRKCQKYLN